MGHRRRPGFTLVELLVITSAAALLLAIALPAVGGARAASRSATSQDNLRVLGVAHLVYAADWDGRQLTYVDDFITTYGNGVSDAFSNYWQENGFQHPMVALGWGRLRSGRPVYLGYRTGSNCANASLTLPVVFSGEGCNPALAFFGSFRLHNATQFNQYLTGRFYDEVFYAPKDTVVIDAIRNGEDGVDCLDVPDGYCRFANVSNAMGEIPAWSSYCMSPAAMFDPAIFTHDDPDDPYANGWVDPWSRDDGYRGPGLAMAIYPHLKSLMLEHHWLQANDAGPCNPAFDPCTYGDDGCEPYYFNHGFPSRPVTLFYDGHVGEIAVTAAIADDALVREQNNPNWGLWSQDTPWGVDGYLSAFAFDDVVTSFHVLTTDGILGRDILEPGAMRPHHDPAPGRSTLRPARPFRRGPQPTRPATTASLTE